MNRNNLSIKKEMTLEDIEEEINLEDFEDFEEDDSSGFDESVEYQFYPMNKDYLTKLPDHLNPEKIRKKREIVLFNPHNLSNPYTPTRGEHLDINNVCDELIILSKRDIRLIITNRHLTEKQSLIKSNHNEFIEKVKKKVAQNNKNNNSYKPKKNQNKSRFRKK